MKSKRILWVSLAAVLSVLLIQAGAFAMEAGQQKPKKLSSIGDSITEAIDAELPGANHWASWVNGYHGFWQWLFGLTNVNSHNQRISRAFGRRGRKNYMEAESGADSFDLVAQATQAVSHWKKPTYVTIFMGHNDVCQNDFSEIPTDEEFEENVSAALDILKDGLPEGATIYVVGLVDIYQLWKVGQDKKALGIVDCEVLWFFTLFDLFPCGTMLSPLNTEDARQATRERNIAFNGILEALVSEYNSNDPDHFYYYTDDIFEFGPILESHISDIDCFHPSAEGQTMISEITWCSDDGPDFDPDQCE